MEIKETKRVVKGIIIVCAIGVGICVCLMLIFAQASNLLDEKIVTEVVTEADLILPTGYTILCSEDGVSYGVRLPSGKESMWKWGNKRKAIEYAILYERPVIKWVECPVED